MISPVCFLQTMLRIDQEAQVVPELLRFLRLYEADCGFEFPKVTEIGMTHSEDYEVDQDSVLVPFTGGIASTACVWWALRQGLHPWLLFVDGFAQDKQANAQEREAVKSIFLGLRGPDGLPLWDSPETRKPRLITLPTVEEPGGKKTERKQPISEDCKYHPVDIGTLCFLAQMAARAHGCSRIIWGAFDRERAFIEAMAEFFAEYDGTSETPLTVPVFPLDNREQALVLLKEAESLAELLWQTADSDQLNGAALPRNVSKMVHSCCGPAKTVAECSGCAGCRAWRSCAEPVWQWTCNRSSTDTHQLGDQWLEARNSDAPTSGKKRAPSRKKSSLSRKSKTATKARGKKAPMRRPAKKAPSKKAAKAKAKAPPTIKMNESDAEDYRDNSEREDSSEGCLSDDDSHLEVSHDWEQSESEDVFNSNDEDFVEEFELSDDGQ